MLGYQFVLNIYLSNQYLTNVFHFAFIDSINSNWSYWSYYGVPPSYSPHGSEQFSPLFRPSTEISHLISRILVFTTYVVIGTNSAELAKSAWTGFPLKVPASPHRLGVSFICWPLLQVAVKFWSPVLLFVCGENPSPQTSSNYGPTTNYSAVAVV